MNNTLSKIIIFTAGAAIGSVVTWKLVKTKYEQIAHEEIESIRELYSSESACVEKTKEDAITDEDKADYERIVASYTEEKEEDDVMEPYIIPPEEYDENGYKTESLYYYEDGVLENAITKEVITNPSKLVGDEFVDHFGEFEPDSVYVRNDKIKTDFEILKDGGYYSEVE